MLWNKINNQANVYMRVVLTFSICILLAVVSLVIYTIIIIDEHDSPGFEHFSNLVFSYLRLIAFYSIVLYLVVNKRFCKQLPIVFAANTVLGVIISLENKLWRCGHYDYESFSASFCVQQIINLILGVFLAVFLELLVSEKEKYTKYHDFTKKYWFLPAVICIARVIIVEVVNLVIILQPTPFSTVSSTVLAFLSTVFTSLISSIPDAVGLLFLCQLLKDYPELKCAEETQAPNVEDYFKSMTSHVLLLLFTFGIYFWAWVYKTTEFTNSIPNTPYRRNPTTKLLLCMFVPFYYLYWIHYTCKEIERYSKTKGIPCSISTLCVVLALFTYFFVSPIIMQSKLNEAIQHKTVTEQQPATEEISHSKSQEAENIDALKQYKELLDSGILTQEEFDAKKQQLLGL